MGDTHQTAVPVLAGDVEGAHSHDRALGGVDEAREGAVAEAVQLEPRHEVALPRRVPLRCASVCSTPLGGSGPPSQLCDVAHEGGVEHAVGRLRVAEPAGLEEQGGGQLDVGECFRGHAGPRAAGAGLGEVVHDALSGWSRLRPPRAQGRPRALPALLLQRHRVAELLGERAELALAAPGVLLLRLHMPPNLLGVRLPPALRLLCLAHAPLLEDLLDDLLLPGSLLSRRLLPHAAKLQLPLPAPLRLRVLPPPPL